MVGLIYPHTAAQDASPFSSHRLTPWRTIMQNIMTSRIIAVVLVGTVWAMAYGLFVQRAAAAPQQKTIRMPASRKTGIRTFQARLGLQSCRLSTTKRSETTTLAWSGSRLHQPVPRPGFRQLKSVPVGRQVELLDGGCPPFMN
jgi:hypothetical protein